MSEIWKTRSTEVLLDRPPWFEVLVEEVELPGGRRVARDRIHHPGASAVVPFVSDDEILLIRQYRHAAGGEIYEVPAGKLDPGETPLECAVRDLEEATARNWMPMAVCLVPVSYTHLTLPTNREV